MDKSHTPNIISPHVSNTLMSISAKVKDFFYKLQMLWFACYHHNLSMEMYIYFVKMFSPVIHLIQINTLAWKWNTEVVAVLTIRNVWMYAH